MAEKQLFRIGTRMERGAESYCDCALRENFGIIETPT